jgi:ABC-2 type transport system permease protein
VVPLRGIYVIWLRELLRFGRERARIVGMVAQPLLYLLLVGNGLAHGFQFKGGSHINYLTFMFPGIVAMSVLFTSVFSAMSIVWDREFGFLKEVLVSPVPRYAIAVGKALGGTTVAVVQGAVILALGPLVGMPVAVAPFLGMLGVLGLLALALNGLGILVASRMTSMQGFQVVMNFLVMPLFFLSGALYPLKGMPEWLGTLMRIDPVTYGVDALRHLIYANTVFLQLVTQFSLGTDLLVTLGLAAALLSVATMAFGTAREA